MAKKKKTKAKPAKTKKKVKAAKATKPARKTVKAKKAKKPVKAKKTVRKPVKAKTAKKPARKVAAKKAPAKKAKKSAEILGEGNYTASRRFRKEQTDFVKQNKAKIPELAKEAEDALEGSEGNELRAAEAEGRSHAHMPE